MPVNRPYRRTCRQFVDGRYLGSHGYVRHPNFAQSPEHYVRAFLILLKDLQELFDYIEPADKNLQCYSYRIHALLIRACVEVEANCKAILKENGYARSGDWNMRDYAKIEKSHLLSAFEVKLPIWSGTEGMRTPFFPWSTADSRLTWYAAYNATKHARHTEFEQANFASLIDACCGLFVLLSAQFETDDFSVESTIRWGARPTSDGMRTGIGEFFRVRFPDNWPMEDRYDFNYWQDLQSEADPFKDFDYSTV
jgi:hypothetical protein